MVLAAAARAAVAARALSRVGRHGDSVVDSSIRLIKCPQQVRVAASDVSCRRAAARERKQRSAEHGRADADSCRHRHAPGAVVT